MRKLWFTLLILAATLLAACSPTRSTAPTAAPTTKALPTDNPSAVKMACQVVSLKPTQGPTEVSMFPPASKEDWILGKNPQAALTIIEYSDFQ